MAKKPEATNFDKLLEELNGAKKAGADGTVEAAPVQKKSGFVTLIGRPNVGKSTLMNHLIGQKIAITSDKPLDTPGIHKAKNKLGEYMVNVAEHTLKEVDLILWLVEPSTFIGAGERHIAEQLQGIKTPIILVINKTDTVKNQEDILTFINAYKDICNFAEIVPVSALRDKNTDRLLEQLFKYLPYGPQFYDEDTVTDQPMRQIAAELIREKALRMLDEEIPHGIAVTIEKMSERPNGIMDVEATIICERDSHKGIIIGKGGAMLKRIGSAARRELEDMLETKVNLQIWVKVRREWRDSELLMKNYGYNPKE